jgi:hypothetical protein
MDQQLQAWRRKRLNQHNIINFWYFAFIDNLHLILQYGILPKNEVDRRGLQYRSFAEETVQIRRHHHTIHLSNQKEYKIHDVVPVYLCPKTPTLSARREIYSELVFLRIQSFILLDDEVEFAFTDGNAASRQTRFFVDLNHLEQLPWDVIRCKYWNDFTDGLRKRNSEFLIHPCIPVERIWDLYVVNETARTKVQGVVDQCNSRLKVSIKQDMFF